MKFLLKSLAGILVVVVIALIVLGFIAWSRAPDIVANNLSKKLKVSVSIDEINPGFTSVEIDKLEIGNPAGSILSKAFSANSTSIEAPWLNYLDQKIVIDEIEINDIYLGLEFETPLGTKGNWTKIMSNLKSSTAQENQEASSRSVLIKKLALNNISVDVVYEQGGGKVKRLPNIDHIVLTDVTSEGGIPMNQLMNTVLGQMLRQVFEKENLKNMLEGILENPQGTVEKIIQPFKGLFHSRIQGEEEVPLLFQVS